MTISAGAAPLLHATGIAGLDEILRGGLPRHRLHLVEGDPGSGKTTLALHFLREGARQGERGLFVALSESADELRATAESFGWSLDGIDVFELTPSDDSLKADARYTMFHPSEVELGDTIRALLAEVERTSPARVVFDSLSELRLLAQDSLRYRRQVLALKQFFAKRCCTVLMVDDRTSTGTDMVLFSIAHGVISLERRSPEYGALRRRIQIPKMRGRAFLEGFHDFTIRGDGLRVFTRLGHDGRAPAHAPKDPVPSGVDALDALLGGGLARGTSNLVVGPAGAGKSSLAMQFVAAAAGRGERSAVYLFDESVDTSLARSSGLGLRIADAVDAGTVQIRAVDAAELSPGELVSAVVEAVERDGARMVVIDSLNGLLHSVGDDRLLTLHLHQLLSFLGQCGVTSLLLLAQQGVVGPHAVPIDATYLADTVMLLRFFEAAGELRKALSVFKKRTGPHEATIRELRFGGDGLAVGEPLREFQGVLTGVPAIGTGLPPGAGARRA